MSKKRSAKKPKKPWRELEEQISEIEKTLCPHGADVRSPDRIRDKITGQLREVDGAIRHNVGSTQVLITIECRRRKGKSDVRWIEHLVTKQKSIGAAKTIALSFAGLSKPALACANHYGIEVRKVRELTSEEITRWIKDLRITMLGYSTTFHGAKVQFEPSSPPGPVILAEHLLSFAEEKGCDAVVIQDKTSGEMLSIKSLFQKEALLSDGEILEKLQAGGGKFRLQAAVDFPEKQYSAETNKGVLALIRMFVDVEFQEYCRDVPQPTRVIEYGNDVSPIAHFAESICDLGPGVEMTVSYRRDADTANLKPTIHTEHQIILEKPLLWEQPLPKGDSTT
jgi:hypothetical protein